MTVNRMSTLHTDQQEKHLIISFSHLRGAGDSFLFDHWDEILRKVDEHKPESVTFDLSNSPTISSSSISVLLSLYKKHIKVRLYQPAPAVRDVLEVTHLVQMFPETQSLVEVG